MKRTLLKTVLCLLVCWTGVIAYIGTQEPKFWWNEEWAGIMLRKGNYRSWSMRFCDGQVLDVDGKWKCVIFKDQTNMIIGRYMWPRFSHVDLGLFGDRTYSSGFTNGFSNTLLLK